MKTKDRLFLVFVVLFCVYSGTMSAQEQDFSGWSRLAVKYDWSKKTRLTVEEEFRFKNNLSQLGQNHTEVGITHELWKRWEGGLFYRFIYQPDPDRYYSLGHRFWAQLEYRLVDRDIRVSVRNRTQATYENMFSSQNGLLPEWYNRYKISAEYQPKKADWVPGAGIELWHHLNPDGSPYIDKFRTSTGIEYRPGKHFRYELFYSFEQELNQNNPKTDHIVGINITFLIN